MLARGTRGGTLCSFLLVLAGGGSSDGTGYTDIFPEAERVSRFCLVMVDAADGEGETDNEMLRTSESSGMEAIIFPSFESPPCRSGTSQIYTNRSPSAAD